MDDRDRVASLFAAPKAIELADGKTYRFSPLTIQDLEELNRHCKYRRLRDVERESRGFDAETRARLIDRAQDSCEAMSTAELAAEIQSIYGLRYLFWLAVRANHPDVTLEKISELVQPGNVDWIKDQYDGADGSSDPT